jgi:3-hydroxybutyryl-CoA dehydrogenase
MDIKSIAVIGGGTMGNGIAHIFSLKGFNVNLVEMNEELLNRSLKTITTNLERQVKKETITDADKQSTLSRIKSIIGVENTPRDADLIIEAIFENKDAKLSIFNKLNSIIKEESIFASNTSSISITELSTASRPDRFIGMHFMNPVPVMKLVEIIRGYSTSNQTYNSIKDLTQKLDKAPVEVFDYPGFAYD